MKQLCITVVFGLLLCTSIIGQSVNEVNPPDFSRIYLELWDKLDSITEANPEVAISEMDQAMKGISNPYERYNIYFWGYPSAYLKMKTYDELLDLLLKAQNEGHYFMLRRGERAWPDWVPELEKLDDNEAFFTENDLRKEKAQENATAEYFVQLPDGYDQNRTYPLLLVLHGGVGSHYQSSESWKSGKLGDEFIVAFLQGEIAQGSFQRSFNREGVDNIFAMYNQIIQTYPVDTGRIYVGGPSAGGMRSIILGYDDRFNLAGLLLAFAVVPRNIGDEQFDIIKAKNLRLVLITGENDFGLVQQKKFMVSLDEKEIPNRFLVFPEKGHEYPEDFSHHLDTSIDFLFKSEEIEGN